MLFDKTNSFAKFSAQRRKGIYAENLVKVFVL